MKLTPTEQDRVLRERIQVTYACLGRYFMRNYDTEIYDSVTHDLVKDVVKAEEHLDKFESKQAMKALRS